MDKLYDEDLTPDDQVTSRDDASRRDDEAYAPEPYEHQDDTTGIADDARDAMKEGWDKTKEVAENAWDKTKEAGRDARREVEDVLD